MAAWKLYQDENPETVNVPGYPEEITYERADELEKQGVLSLVGLDENGDPKYVLSGVGGKGVPRKPSMTRNMAAG